MQDRTAKSTGFDFSAAVRRVCEDMASRVDALSHIDMRRVGVGFCQTRKNVPHGLQATLTPLRFQNGAVEGIRRGRRYRVARCFDDRGIEYLYLLHFYLPRFLNHSLEEKLATIAHELWHVGPRFDGDLRRHDGRCYVHGSSEKEFEAQANRLAQAWLALDPPEQLYRFLTSTFAELVAEHGAVFGRKIAAPRLIPVEG